MKIGLRTVLLLGALVLALAGCGGGGGGGSSLPDPRIRFVNASPDSDPLSFFVNNDERAANLGFLQSTSSFSSLEADDYDIFLRETGTTFDIDAMIQTVSNDTDYIIASVGLQNFGSESVKRQRLASFEVDTNIPNGTKARIVVLHAFNRATGFDTPNIDFQNPGTNPQNKVSNIAFGSTSVLEVDAVSQTFEARRVNTENVYVSRTFTFDAGGIYLAVVSGIEGGAGAQAPQIEYIKLN